jgi:hypothetical protein
MIFHLFIVFSILVCVFGRDRWTIEKSLQWQKSQGFRAGANFVPSTAVNELEMFQAETYDPVTIDRELQWAQDAGFNTMRVFLHNLLWDQGSADFLNRVDNFLSIADKHGMNVMLVLFDSCWNQYPKSGPQPDPIPGVHNSQWVQAPGVEILNDPVAFDNLKGYVQGVISHFQNDSRVMAWDIWNEPDNSHNSPDLISPLITKAFEWAREVNPHQPLTTPLWNGDIQNWSEFRTLQIELSDVISFHNYAKELELKIWIDTLRIKGKGRPIICTEYMARTVGSYFEPHLQIMKDENVFAINWGVVSGRTQTIYPWSTTVIPAKKEPEIWFHDIWHDNGIPFNQSEIDYIRSVLKPSAVPINQMN